RKHFTIRPQHHRITESTFAFALSGQSNSPVLVTQGRQVLECTNVVDGAVQLFATDVQADAIPSVGLELIGNRVRLRLARSPNHGSTTQEAAAKSSEAKAVVIVLIGGPEKHDGAFVSTDPSHVDFKYIIGP